MSTPYDIEVRVWRDEQPGDKPRLHVAATFVPREGGWSEVTSASLELRAKERSWTPEQIALRARPDGGFEIRAEGTATIAAGATVVPVASLTTAAGDKELTLPESVVQLVR